MGYRKQNWKEQMKASPFTQSHFTNALRQQVLQRTKQGRSKRRSTLFSAVLAVTVTCSAALLFSDDIGKWLERSALLGYKTGSDLPSRPSYYDRQGNELLTVYPEPELKAAQQAGYLFHFTAPFETFQDRTLAIYATHQHTGFRQLVAVPTVITEPSSGYTSLGRHTVSFSLPLSGMWRYEVELDGKPYANVDLPVQEPSWDTSPTFESGSYLMRGVRGKVGLIDQSLKAGSPQKIMWHFWGTEQALDGPFEVKAVKQGKERIIDLFSASGLGQSLNGADRSLPSLLTVPEPGRWRLLPYISGQLMESIVVEVALP